MLILRQARFFFSKTKEHHVSSRYEILFDGGLLLRASRLGKATKHGKAMAHLSGKHYQPPLTSCMVRRAYPDELHAYTPIRLIYFRKGTDAVWILIMTSSCRKEFGRRTCSRFLELLKQVLPFAP